MKRILLEFVKKNPMISRFIFYICNGINPKNQISRKGIKLSIGNSLLDGMKVKSSGINNEIIIGNYVRIKNSTIVIRGSNNRVVIDDYAYLNQVDIYMEDENNEIVIGEHTSLCGKAHMALIEGTKIKIGDNCLLSSDLHFRTGDSHSILNSDGVRINPSEDILIGNHVWVGTKVTCLKGVTIPNECIVAATSTLCKKYYETNCIIGGVPAKIVRRNVSWCHARI